MRPGPKPSPTLEIWLSDTLDGAASVVIVGLVIESLIGIQGVPRILVALAFLFFVPGRAVTTNWNGLALRSQVTVSMLFSLVILALFATVTLWIHYWHPLGLMQAEAGLSLLGLAIAAVRRHWYGRRDRSAARDTGADSNGGGPGALHGLELLMTMSRTSAESAAPEAEAARPGDDQTTRDSSGSAEVGTGTDRAVPH